MRWFLWCLLMSDAAFAYPHHANVTVYSIKPGDEPERYSEREIRHRMWQLEKAVRQLQERVFELELREHDPVHKTVVITESVRRPEDTWICTIAAMGDTYSAAGPTKASAMDQVIGKCRAGRGGDGFFCKISRCEN